MARQDDGARRGKVLKRRTQKADTEKAKTEKANAPKANKTTNNKSTNHNFLFVSCNIALKFALEIFFFHVTT
jgi:hypothetical protein